MKPTFSIENLNERLPGEFDAVSKQAIRVMSTFTHHFEKIGRQHANRWLGYSQQWFDAQQHLAQSAESGQAQQEAIDYAVDSAQRTVLTLDVLRERGNQDKAHQDAGTPPVLIYDYDVIMDGHDFARPANYLLLKILPPAGVEVFDWKRPYMIIDPRAGHGAGIGGFKPDSQVGVALHAGHPVYFVVFRQHPEPGQTLADVMRAEAEFVREIKRRHPEAPNPVVVGNCQGGWATLILAAANPEITGPLIINGAPVSAWSGHLGENPMRYNGGLLGGVVPAMLMSDLGYGEFDGAHLVSNFEMLNPGRNHFGKYYDLYTNVREGRESFLEFEKWWGGYHFTNEAEIRWIIDNIFVGNRLARGEAELEPGRHLDLKNIRSPIIVFASRGDNITPPQQALNWIVDTYADENEIRIRGQRIVYMVHDKVGHLGIFVSSSIAKKEHTEMASTLKTIESLAPGLYEMVIEDSEGGGHRERFVVSFHERKLADILTVVPNDRDQERSFAAVARLSELGANLYDMAARPMVQNLVTQPLSQAIKDAHPARVTRRMFSDENPAMPLLSMAAKAARASDKPAAPGNPFIALEKIMADSVTQSLDLMRDVRDAAYETTFLSIYGTPVMNWLGTTHAFERTRKDPKELRYLPEVQAMLLGVDHGDYAAAVIRMLILLAESRGSVRRDRLERSSQVLTQHEPFVSMGPERRMELIRTQSVIVEFEPERALLGLSKLLKHPEQRQQAMDTVHFITGSRSEMEPHTLSMFQRMEEVLGVAVESGSALPPDAHAEAQPLEETPAAPVAGAKRTSARKKAAS
ncbi:MAG: DUF3141 domain-containing protein [Burkholderiaceae bacterium]|nr:DUF3141 domain-containing protein [Burkholderiaceae bacterium]